MNKTELKKILCALSLGLTLTACGTNRVDASTGPIKPLNTPTRDYSVKNIDISGTADSIDDSIEYKVRDNFLEQFKPIMSESLNYDETNEIYRKYKSLENFDNQMVKNYFADFARDYESRYGIRPTVDQMLDSIVINENQSGLIVNMEYGRNGFEHQFAINSSNAKEIVTEVSSTPYNKYSKELEMSSSVISMVDGELKLLNPYDHNINTTYTYETLQSVNEDESEINKTTISIVENYNISSWKAEHGYAYSKDYQATLVFKKGPKELSFAITPDQAYSLIKSICDGYAANNNVYDIINANTNWLIYAVDMNEVNDLINTPTVEKKLLLGLK